jgi:hypothetical protein
MLQFFHGPLSPDYSFSFEPAIFNRIEHLQLQSADGWKSFFALDDASKRVMAVIHFNVSDGKALSPFRASFGGLEFVDELSENQLSDFLTFVTNDLNAVRVRKAIVKQLPFLKENPKVTNSFLRSGFKIQLTEVDSFIKVAGDFTDLLQERKAKKLRSLKKEGWSFRSCDLRQLPETYDFISKCREAKGYDLSMTLLELHQLASAFDDRIFLFQVIDRERIIAAAICIRVKSNWLYDFYHDHDASFDADSPVLFLVDGIFDYCKRNSIDLVELGTSMHGDQVNEGLLEFKERLGAITVPKITFVKEF